MHDASFMPGSDAVSDTIKLHRQVQHSCPQPAISSDALQDSCTSSVQCTQECIAYWQNTRVRHTSQAKAPHTTPAHTHTHRELPTKAKPNNPRKANSPRKVDLNSSNRTYHSSGAKASTAFLAASTAQQSRAPEVLDMTYSCSSSSSSSSSISKSSSSSSGSSSSSSSSSSISKSSSSSSSRSSRSSRSSSSSSSRSSRSSSSSSSSSSSE